MSKSLYVLGTNAHARFLASQFAARSDKSMRLKFLFPTDTIIKSYMLAGSKVTYNNEMDPYNPVRATYHIPGVMKPKPDSGQMRTLGRPAVLNRYIDYLVVTDSRLQRATALKSYKEYIDSNTHILFVNPLLDTTSRVLTDLYGTDIASYPKMWQALSGHTLENGRNMDVKHLDSGPFRVSSCPRPHEPFMNFIDNQTKLFPNDCDLPHFMRKLLELPMLCGIYMPFKEAYLAQVEKLIIGSATSSITLQDRAHSSHSSDATRRITSSVVDECVNVATRLSKIKALKRTDNTVNAILDRERLIDVALQRLQDAPPLKNLSNRSLLEGDLDLAAPKADPRSTNGYIAMLGRRLNVPTPTNQMLVDLWTIQNSSPDHIKTYR